MASTSQAAIACTGDPICITHSILPTLESCFQPDFISPAPTALVSSYKIPLPSAPPTFEACAEQAGETTFESSFRRQVILRRDQRRRVSLIFRPLIVRSMVLSVDPG